MISATKRTKIVATLGPASTDKEMITKIIEAGANVLRLNFSHGSHEDHLERINTIRSISDEKDYHVALLQDLQGPKILNVCRFNLSLCKILCNVH